MADRPRQEGQGALIALWFAVIIFGWGGNYAIVKLALQDSAPFTFNALRFLGAALLIAVILTIRGESILPKKGERLGLTLVGFCQVTMMLGLTSVALQWIEASRAVLLAYTMFLWAVPLEMLISGASLPKAKIAGATICLTGLCVLLNPLAMDWAAPGVLLGSGLALLGTIGWALGATLYARRQWQSTFWNRVFWQVFAGALPLAGLAIVFEQGRTINPSPLFLSLLVYNWIIPAALAYWCWAKVLSRMSVSVAGQILLLAPVYGVFLAHLLFDEPLDWTLILSAALILSGAWLSISKSRAGEPHRGNYSPSHK